MKKILSALGLALLAIAPARAIPNLQLDIGGGTYDEVTETTVTPASSFTLYALLGDLVPAGPYYISVALSTTAAGNYGSFVFNGTTVNATSDMVFGTPSQMPPHGVFATWYKEFSFTFDPANKFTNYDVEGVVGTHTGPVANAAGNALYKPFTVDVSNLSPDVELIFDLYTYEVAGKSLKIKTAPFSHNAGTTTTTSVPDGGVTLILLGLATTGLAVARRFARR